MTAPRTTAYGTVPTPNTPPYRPGQASPPEVEPGTSPTAPQDPDLLPDPVPGSEPRTEPDDRAGEPTFLDTHPAARLATQALGATAGAIGGAVAGSVLGIAAGPLGSLAGAAAGAAIGGLAGSGAGVDDAEADDDSHWREAFTSRPYVRNGTYYDDWAPAYRYGADAYRRHAPMGTWSEAEGRLGMGWPDARGDSPLLWDEARHAARDGWERMKQRHGK